jgi:hypothetical protein
MRLDAPRETNVGTGRAEKSAVEADAPGRSWCGSRTYTVRYPFIHLHHAIERKFSLCPHFE